MSKNAVNVVEVDIEQKEILASLMQFYRYDLSEFNNDDVDSSGKLSVGKYFDVYWIETERHPFFIKQGNKLIGFALVRELCRHRYSVAEFFIMRKYRHLGFGRQAAFTLFDRFKGEWHVAQEQNNAIAQTFWRSIIRDYTNNRFEETFSVSQPKGPEQVFYSRTIL
ncbi:MAG: GNAT family N-acetyltransferase [Cyanobacteria bacterium J06649_4]